MCKETLWVREGVSLDHSNRAHKHVPFAETEQSVFLCLKEEFKAQQGAQRLSAGQALGWIYVSEPSGFSEVAAGLLLSRTEWGCTMQTVSFLQSLLHLTSGARLL